MASFKRFEEIVAWQKARVIVVDNLYKQADEVASMIAGLSAYLKNKS